MSTTTRVHQSWRYFPILFNRGCADALVASLLIAADPGNYSAILLVGSDAERVGAGGSRERPCALRGPSTRRSSACGSTSTSSWHIARSRVPRPEGPPLNTNGEGGLFDPRRKVDGIDNRGTNTRNAAKPHFHWCLRVLRSFDVVQRKPMNALGSAGLLTTRMCVCAWRMLPSEHR